MSPRAACRLTHLGFERVYDYVPGKADWVAAGLPREGRSAQLPNAGDLVHRHTPTCHFRDRAVDAPRLMHAHDVNFCVAVTKDNVVLGMVYRDEVQDGDAKTIEQVMRPGPTTIRASEPLEPLVERMTRVHVDAILVTDPEGRLLGLLDRRRAHAAISTTRPTENGDNDPPAA
jgi:CBS-domain-containing membrane protein